MDPTTTQTVAGIFRRILEIDQIQDETNFFEAGGDSLLGTRVLSAIAGELDVELTFDDFARAPTPAALAERIATAPQGTGEIASVSR